MNKKIFLYGLFFLMIAVFLTSCRSFSQISHDEEIINDNSTHWIIPDDSVNFSDMNLYRQNDNFYFIENADVNIYLYVNAEKDIDGEFMFDDRNEWLLIVTTPFGDYPLFPREFLLGRVDYTAFNEWSGDMYDIFHVLVTIRETAGYKIYDYIFDNEKKAFKQVLIYNALNINPIGTSN